MKFDIKQVSVILNGYTLTGLSDDTSSIDVKFTGDAGKYTIGANGKGVWIANPDCSGTLTIKLLQQHQDNAWAAQQHALQRSDLKAFTPFSLNIRDLINNDLVTGTSGMFKTASGYTRGNQHNPGTWVIEFESLQQLFSTPYEG